MTYLVALDYEHLDNGMFLTAFAGALAQHSRPRIIIVHGDSAYTERIIQTGVMRDEALRLSIKGLNHRLVSLFADEGVSCIGLNGYQREFISRNDSGLHVNTDYLENLPQQPVLLLSNLVHDARYDQPQPVELPQLTATLQQALNPDEVFLFSRNDADEIIQNDLPEKLCWDSLEADFKEQYLPAEFRNSQLSLRLTTARLFRNLPDTSGTTLVH